MTVLGPYPLAPVIERLRAAAPSLKLVGTAADLRTALEQHPNTSPTAVVARAERSGKPVAGSGGLLLQLVGVELEVVLFVRHAGDARSGSGARGAMDALINEVRSALLRFVPDGSLHWRPLVHERGRDEYFHGDWLTSVETFSTSYPIEVRP